MQTLIVSMLIAAVSFQFLASKEWLPRLLVYSPEVLALVATLLVVVYGVASRFKHVRPAYWLVFGSLAVVVASGIAVNAVEAGPIFAGIRNYLRALPFFFLPAVMAVRDRQLRWQLYLLIFLVALQLPLAVEQRMATTARGGVTGDDTFGTLMNAGLLTVFLIAAACVLTGFYMRKMISTKAYVVLLLLFLMPTTLNESKVTLVLLPMALLTTMYIGSAVGTRLKNVLLGVVLLAGFTAIFIPIYDHYMKPRWGYGIVDFLMMEGRVEGYLYRGTNVGDEAPGARLDGTMVAYRDLSRDPSTLAFGFGIGNASLSALGDQFTGRYFTRYESFRLNSFTYILLELGVLGLTLVLLLHWLIFRDSVVVARHATGLMGALAIGWAGANVTMVVTLVYHNPVPNPALSCLFWYFSGLVAAHRMRLAMKAPEAVRATASPPRLAPVAG